MIQNFKLLSSRNSFIETPEQQIAQLTEKVKTLTESLKIKTDQVQCLLNLHNNPDDQLSDLMQALESKSREIKYWEDKYAQLQQTKCQESFIQSSFCDYGNSDMQEFHKSKLQAKQEEINCLRFQVSDLETQINIERNLVRELEEQLMDVEKERLDIKQFKCEMKEQLQNYKQQVITLQEMLDNKMRINDSFIEPQVAVKKQLNKIVNLDYNTHLSIQNKINQTMADINRSLEQINLNNPSFAQMTTKQSSPY